MTTYFLDSSALLKRYVMEVGTNWIRSITFPASGHSVLIAQITSAEIVSGVMRRKRENAIQASPAHAMRLLIDYHTQRDYNTIGLSSLIVQHAEDLLEKHPLRAYDSIQLASALEGNQRLMQSGQPALIFVSAD